MSMSCKLNLFLWIKGVCLQNITNVGKSSYRYTNVFCWWKVTWTILPVQSALTPPIIPSFDQAYHIAQLETEIFWKSGQMYNVYIGRKIYLKFNFIFWAGWKCNNTPETLKIRDWSFFVPKYTNVHLKSSPLCCWSNSTKMVSGHLSST